MAGDGGRGRPTILVVDDEPKIGRLIRYTFGAAGYQVLHALDGESGVALARSARPDLILMDLTMPRLGGIHACERIREQSDVPIIMLTGEGTERDKIRGLDAGADDYVVKPFTPGELVARVRAVLRRTSVEESAAAASDESPAPAYDDGVLRIDLTRREVALRGQLVRLSRLELRLLETLVDRPGQIFQHDQLVSRVWGEAGGASIGQLRTCVKCLRRKIEPDPTAPRYLLARPGLGYTFRAQRAAAALT